MSHLINTIESQTGNRAGDVDLSLANVGNFTSTTNKVINLNSSGEIVQADAPSSSFKWAKCYHYRGIETQWGGGGYTVTGEFLSWRKASGTRDYDSSYASDLLNGSGHSTWANQIRLQTSTYLFNFSANYQVMTANDQLTFRLKNITDNTYYGPTMYWGASQQSNTMYAYVTISGQKDFGLEVQTVVGSPYFPSKATLEHTHLNVWRIV